MGCTGPPTIMAIRSTVCQFLLRQKIEHEIDFALHRPADNNLKLVDENCAIVSAYDCYTVNE